jgi:hypothetical protein
MKSPLVHSFRPLGRFAIAGAVLCACWVARPPALHAQNNARQARAAESSPLREIEARFFEGSWQKLPDFSTLTPKSVHKIPASRFDIAIATARDNFGLVFTGFLEVPADGEYTFHLSSDDGSRLLVDGRMVVEHDGVHPAGDEQQGKATLTKGMHPVRLEYFELGGGEELHVAWSGPGFKRQWLSPRRKSRPGSTKWDQMDLGPFFSGYLQAPGVSGHVAYKGLSIKLGTTNEAAVCFDTELMRMAYGWTGGFIDLPTGRDGLEGFAEVVGEEVFATPRLPGWARAGSFVDPRPAFPKGEPHCGPLPRDWAHWRGMHLHGDKVVLSYTVGGAGVLELPAVESHGEAKLLARSFQIDATAADNHLLVCEDTRATARIENGVALLTHPGGELTAVGVVGANVTLQTADKGRVILQVPKSPSARRFKLLVWRGEAIALPSFHAALKATAPPVDLAAFTKPGPARWTEEVTTKGRLGLPTGPYVVDTITVPEDNPWKSWIRCSGFDFFKDGRVALCSVSGDVWIVSGIDARLEKLTWKRFATGLFQPLGLRIVDEKVYVLGRDQLTRLHDLNNDGEADFYENFNNDVSITGHYHEFSLNLETDAAGNFYFIKGGNLGAARIPHHGTLNRISKDGSRLEVVATGHRAPNGMGISPTGQLTSADNEGNWIPSSRINWVVPGGFYGHVHTAHRDPEPTSYDPPLFWLPHQIDNSSGGQVWVTSDQWGAFQGDMLHLSYGKCDLFKVMHESVDGVMQGGVVKFPLTFESGVMRGRFSPFDGQLYLAGLRVWQSSGAREGAFHRVRYTGKPVHLPDELRVKPNGVEITFTQPLDPEFAGDSESYAVDRWNYLWSKEYGSKHYSVEKPGEALGDKGQAVFKGEDVAIKSVKLSNGNKTVFLELADVRPVMQQRIRFNIDAADGTQIRSEIYHTINAVPK